MDKGQTMKAINQARADISAAVQSLQAVAACDEPDDLAAALAGAGDGIARAIATLDGTFKGFRRDVETTARKLAARAQQ